MSTCYFVCLSDCWRILKTTVQIQPNFLYMLPMVMARSLGSSLTQCYALCASGFVDDVMLSY